MPLPIPSLRETRAVLRQYRGRHGRYPNLLRPRRFSEFIQRRKLFDRAAVYGELSDKLRVREFASARCGERILVPLQWVGRNAAAIPFRTLSYPAIVKPNHLWQQLFVLTAPPDDESRTRIVRDADKWLAMKHGRATVEPAYYRIHPYVLVEQLLVDADGKPARDFKLHVFRGRVELIQVHVDRFGEHRRCHFDRNWRRLPFAWRQPAYAGEIAAPANLTDLIATAEQLARGFHYLRVDLYSVGGRVFLGEITVYPESGLAPTDPPEWDVRLGDVWRGRLHLDRTNRL